MSRKGYVTISVILMIISGIMISLAFLYCSLEDKVINFRYSDNEEYNDINEGIKFIEKMPIQFNIINKYFSDMNNLTQEEKEQIVLAYAVKNRYKQYNCGPSTANINYNCVTKETLKDKELQKIFNLNLNFESNKIDIYMGSHAQAIIFGRRNLECHIYQ